VTVSPQLAQVGTNKTAWVLFVDDMLVSGRLEIPRLSIPFHRMSPGWHNVRIMAFTDTAVRQYSEFVGGFMVPGERQVKVEADGKTEDGKLRFKPSATDSPKTLRLRHGYRTLGEGEVIEVDPAVMGSGPVTLTAEADYEPEKMRVRAEPLKVEVVP